jgi:hypothetical protein
MRSLWRTIAARWLGGRASDALTGDAVLLDLLTPAEGQASPVFLVRQSAVSHRAMMSQQDRAEAERETALGPVIGSDGAE